ncbi:MAG: protein kinase domain-containing protein [Propioniciclava sp.]
MTRAPSPPPELPGFSYLQPLGSGGFADVFLYEQQLPRRRVAVKVLLAERISSGAAEEFTDEANVMAMLSTHPAIVTIHQAGVAGDGRPYLVMEYCPRPNLQVRSQKEPFSVAEALRVGVQVAGAVETAHRAGVLHRDIKPANILVTEYNRPALTDFGIASTTGAVTEAAGMSIPWSPPESFADPPRGGPRTDVYALAATVYTLLAGRTPFERPSERNTSAELIERIERMALPPLHRPDAPASLHTALHRAMAKNPDDRYPSAVGFARSLQKIQIELAHSVTPIDIVDEHPADDDDGDDGDGLTRVREVVSIDPEASATRPSAATQPNRPEPSAADPPRFGQPAPTHEDTQLRTPTPAPPAVITAASVPATPMVSKRPTPAPAASTAAGSALGADQTVLRAPQSVAPQPDPAASLPALTEPEPGRPPMSRSPRLPWWGWLVVGCGLLVAAVAVWLFDDVVARLPTPTPSPSVTSQPIEVVPHQVPPVASLTGTRSAETVTFTWENPAPEPGDSYIWNEITLDGPLPAANIEETRVTLTGARPDRTCIEVSLKRADGRSSEPERVCVE